VVPLNFTISSIHPGPAGIEIEIIISSKTIIMKKSLKKFINASMTKIKQHKEQIKKFSLSTYKEDFVITAQEEKEGGFFGQTFSRLKINNAT
jgi:hypothetical protein